MLRKIIPHFILIAMATLLLSSTNSIAEAKVENILADQLNLTEGIALCPNGRLFTVENGSGKMFEIIDDETATLFIEGFARPAGMACDSQNLLYVLEYTTGKVVSVSLETKELKTVAEGLENPNAIIVSSKGVIYVSDTPQGKVFEIIINGPDVPDGANGPDSAEINELASGLNYPNGLAFNEDESILYINETLGNKTTMTPISGKHRGKTRTAGKKLPAADGIVAANGGFYVCLFAKGELAFFAPKSKTTKIASGMTGPASPVIKDGKIYITSLTGKGLYKVTLDEAAGEESPEE